MFPRIDLSEKLYLEAKIMVSITETVFKIRRVEDHAFSVRGFRSFKTKLDYNHIGHTKSYLSKI